MTEIERLEERSTQQCLFMLKALERDDSKSAHTHLDMMIDLLFEIQMLKYQPKR